MTPSVPPITGGPPAAGPSGSAPPTVCVVLHDVADATLAACERVLRAVEQVAPVPVTLLAVPRYHGRAASAGLTAWLSERCRGGDELALHGFSHLDAGVPRNPVDWLRRRVYTRGEGEFCALSADEAALRLAAGVDWFDRHGWPLQGFVAPAWLLSPGAWQALRASRRFRYTSTLAQMHLLPPAATERLGPGRHHRSRGLVYSSSTAWRRASSVVWARINLAGLRDNPLLRLELHPADADHAAIRLSWQRALAAALRERQASTVAAWVTAWDGSGAQAEAGRPHGPGSETAFAPRQTATAEVADSTP